MRTGSGRRAEMLADAPEAYLRRLSVGLGLALISAIAWMLLLLLPWAQGNLAAAMAGLGAAIGWWAGMVLVMWKRARTMEAVRDALLDEPWLRWAVVGSQALWVVAAMWRVAALAQASAGLTGLLNAAAMGPLFGLLIAAAYASLVLPSVHLGALARWSGDTGLADRLRFASWAIVVGSAGYFAAIAGVLLLGTAVGLLFVLTLLGVMLAAAGGLVLLLSLAQMFVNVAWAERYSRDAVESLERIAERRAREQEEMYQRTARAAAAMDAAEREESGR